MPELPEVETIKRGLEPLIVGATIDSVERLNVQPSQHPRGQFYVDDDRLDNFIVGARVQDIKRRAKVLLIELNSDTTLMIHLKMTGQILLELPRNQGSDASKEVTSSAATATEVEGASSVANDAAGAESDTGVTGSASQQSEASLVARRFGGGHPTKSMLESLPDKTTRTIFRFQNGSQLFFNDQRKFGWIKLLPTDEVELDDFMQRVGPEPWDEDFTAEYLQSKLQNRTIAIKPAILDQSTLAGVGNIYADEALNLSKIDPRKPANSLSKQQYINLHQAIPKVMEDSIKRGGTSFSDYVNHLGFYGDYLQHARVFNREGEQCPNCGGEIKKIKLSGRGTHFCPSCQT